MTSQGVVFLEEPDHVRVSTTSPYQSNIILVAGKVFARSQHEAAWTQTPFPPKPGLTAVMTHLAGAALSGGGGPPIKPLADFYTIAPLPDAAIPAPVSTSAFSLDPSVFSSPPADDIAMFLLTPTNTDLQKSVQELRLGFDTHSHLLVFAQFTTRQGDLIRYWFTNIRLHPTFAPDTFAPLAAPATPHP